ncbi:MAG: FAD-dependent oxidoreductase [Desulfurivibrio sp.]|nr:FAD-dependent oxidoreductase [Desulfurivibrio sp.]
MSAPTDQSPNLNDAAQQLSGPWPPCRNACPVHADVRTYVDHIARQEFAEALTVIRRRLPLAAVCGRICDHPCEANCRRRDVDQAVAIRELKRFAAECPENDNFPATPGAGDRQRVAIIGAGPAGLSAALELARRGFRPTILEKEKQAGGIPGVAIPGYRLPREALTRDIDWILAHGIELRTGVEVGVDTTIKKMKKEGFAAVIIAVGMSQSRVLPLPGTDAAGIYGALDFLRGAAAGRQLELGRELLVIGGGNVACDTARTAVRLGCEKVRMICLESEEEMPALPEEIAESREEGIEIITRRGPMEVVVANGEISGLRHRLVTRVFDEEGRFAPEFDDDDLAVTPCQSVIFAIGQAVEPGFIKGSELELDERGRLVHNPETRQTPVPWIFAAGEAVSPPGTVVRACADGRRVAQGVEQFLQGEEIRLAEETPAVIERLPAKRASQVSKVERAEPEIRPAAQRRQDFQPFIATLPQPQTVNEARRCLECGNGATVASDYCVKCLNCVRICPYDAPQIDKAARVPAENCLACGLCYGACPTGAIRLQNNSPEELVAASRRKLAELSAGQPKTIAYICDRQTTSIGPWREQTGNAEAAAIHLPNPGLLEAGQLLQTLEAGADRILVVLPASDDEYHQGTGHRLRRRVKRLQNDLDAIGLEPEKVQFWPE